MTHDLGESSVSAELHTPRLRLRYLTQADAEDLAANLGNWNVVRMMRLLPHPYTLELAREWITSHAHERKDGKAFRFGICKGSTGARIIGVTDVDEIDGKQGEIGYWLAEAEWGQGYATEAATALLKFAFEELALERLISGRAADNKASGHVLTKLGFRHTGDIRKWSNPRQMNFVQCRYTLERCDWRPA